MYETTTLLENAFEKEETLMNKYQVTVIIGSSILFVFVIIAICVYLMVKFNVCKSNTRDEETITKPQIYFACPVDNDATRSSYTSLEFNENYNSNVILYLFSNREHSYKNTSTSPVDDETRRISNTSLKFNESHDSRIHLMFMLTIQLAEEVIQVWNSMKPVISVHTKIHQMVLLKIPQADIVIQV